MSQACGERRVAPTFDNQAVRTYREHGLVDRKERKNSEGGQPLLPDANEDTETGLTLYAKASGRDVDHELVGKIWKKTKRAITNIDSSERPMNATLVEDHAHLQGKSGRKKKD